MPGAPGADVRDCVAGAPACATMCDEAARSCGSACIGEPDADGDGAIRADCGGLDCDDADPDRFSGNTEVCDVAGHDEDCDPTTVGETDADGDGFVSAACCNAVGAEITCGPDCDDARPSSRPTASEACNTIDDDCDGLVDEDVAMTFYVDADGDGFGDETMPVLACALGAGHAVSGGDCDDTQRARNPGVPEACNAIDDDCDAIVDEGC